ncbi:MAG TPA: sigma-70 family RNA polymerase sigma factor [Verrucomicrobiae bacterium]|nr:sigma-70 family RNA polymerase sigma factor [Verrucomicrobiae bacterium]
MPSEANSVQQPAQLFATTHWTAVVTAGGDTSPESRRALEQLCASYWYPLYAYVRRQGHSVEDSQDLTQQFFLRLLEHKYLRLADPNRGRFRTFLLCSLKNFLTNEWNKANREKRGGGCQVISLDTEQTESRFRAEPADHRTPEKAYSRRWAVVVLDRVLNQLEAECSANGRGPVFEKIKSFLSTDGSESSYAEISQRLGMTEGNLKTTVYRLRQRYRELLRAEIARTVDNPADVDDEIRELLAALND